ncbi:flagellin lysine-N-methylase [Paenibacillus agilis]|uniref:Lysine-N-methylase n=1 Tax=Paenibacillus agilis TaxID=3020863 RepID=A0A559IP66_9BACL|nr:flagellin lysine-N-methylase [Paenibacillus agilis]TVX89441.1 hypothetical protein FPZ44_16805 [Paenibacillus agilis]
MNENTLMPSYMKQFSCIGGDCEDTCCAGWKITLNKEVYKEYKKTKNLKLKNKLKNSMRMETEGTKTKNDYAYFILDDDKKCPMLTSESWCSIQQELGEGALSPTCATYPRVLNHVSEQFELSANVSCPEIARLALFNEKGIDFEQIDYEVSGNWSLARLINTNDTSNYQHLFWSVRMFSIEITQNRKLELCNRLIILGLFIDRIQKEIDAGNTVDIETIVADYRNKMSDVGYINAIQNIAVNTDVQVGIIMEILQFRHKQSATSKRYDQVFNEMKIGYGVEQIDTPSSKLFETYKQNFMVYYAPYMNRHEYVLENYIVNTIFSKAFPSDLSIIFKEYTAIMIYYALMKIHLVGVAGCHNGLDHDIVLRTIQSISKTMEHNAHFARSVIDLLENNKFNSLAHIATLIKDINVTTNIT